MTVRHPQTGWRVLFGNKETRLCWLQRWAKRFVVVIALFFGSMPYNSSTISFVFVSCMQVCTAFVKDDVPGMAHATDESSESSNQRMSLFSDFCQLFFRQFGHISHDKGGMTIFFFYLSGPFCHDT